MSLHLPIVRRWKKTSGTSRRICWFVITLNHGPSSSTRMTRFRSFHLTSHGLEMSGLPLCAMLEPVSARLWRMCGRRLRIDRLHLRRSGLDLPRSTWSRWMRSYALRGWHGKMETGRRWPRVSRGGWPRRSTWWKKRTWLCGLLWEANAFLCREDGRLWWRSSQDAQFSLQCFKPQDTRAVHLWISSEDGTSAARQTELWQRRCSSRRIPTCSHGHFHVDHGLLGNVYSLRRRPMRRGDSGSWCFPGCIGLLGSTRQEEDAHYWRIPGYLRRGTRLRFRWS